MALFDRELVNAGTRFLPRKVIDDEILMTGTDYARLTFEAKHISSDASWESDDSPNVFELNTWVSPHSETLVPVQALLNVSHGGAKVFQDPRCVCVCVCVSLTIIRDLIASRAVDESVRQSGPRKRTRLGVCIVYAGAYRYFLLGRCSVLRGLETTRVQLLNGFVKVVETATTDSPIPKNGGLRS
jgi:hypothetical protein